MTVCHLSGPTAALLLTPGNSQNHGTCHVYDVSVCVVVLLFNLLPQLQRFAEGVPYGRV
jgi:hypothetical protein